MSKTDSEQEGNPRLRLIREEIQRVSDGLNAERSAMAKRAAQSLSPLVSELVSLSDQSKPEAVHDLCGFIRDLCKRHDLAVICPKTGLATQVYSTPRADQGYKPRVSYHIGARPTSHADRLTAVEFTVQPERAASHLSGVTDGPTKGPRSRR